MRLAELGHKVAHLPMGYANQMGKQVYKGVLVLNSDADSPFGEASAEREYIDFKADILVTNKENWVFNHLFKQALNLVPMVIIDHAPVSSQITSRLAYTFKNIAISRFGQRELQKKGFASTYIPLGVRTDIYKPLPKADCKKAFMLNPDDFIVGIVAMNRSRKMIPQMMRGFKRFMELNPELKTKLFLWTNVLPSRSPSDMSLGVADVGVNLVPEIYELGLGDHVNWTKWDDIERVGGLPDFDPTGKWDMCRLYNAFDVLLGTTGGEGAGLPYLEANACFPSDTEVDSSQVIGVYERPYIGNLLEIETERGFSCTPTPNHPILTTRGWISARHIKVGDTLFVGSEYGQKNMDRATISDIVDEVSNNINERFSVDDTTYGSSSSREIQNNEFEEAFQKPTTVQEFQAFGERDRLCSWSRGWRRNNRDIQKIWESTCKENLPASMYNKYMLTSYGLVEGEATATRNMDRQTTNRPSNGEKKTMLSLHDQGDVVLPIFPMLREVPHHQKTTNAGFVEVDRKPSRKNSLAGILRLRDGLVERNTQVEPETVASIGVIPRSTKVYNLTTFSGIYFANGILVHNCGVPSVYTNYAAAPEYAGPTGVPVNAENYVVINTPGTRYYVADVDGIAEGLRKIYDADRIKLAMRCRAFAEKMCWENIIKDYWVPFLKDCEEELRPHISKSGVSTWQ